MMSFRSFFLSRFMFWLAIAVAGSIYLLPNLFVKDTDSRFALSRLKLGIDLKGGTYITLGVEIEKAIENRLVTEMKSLANVFRKKNLKALPVKKEIDNKKLAIVLHFKSDNDAQDCYNLIKNEVSVLTPSIKGNQVIAPLSTAEETRVRSDSVEQASQVISNRLQSLGVEGIIVQRHGNRKVVIQLPGVDDPARIKNLITKKAHLEFKIIKDIGSRDSILDKYDGDLPADMMILPGENAADYEDDETEGLWYLTSAYPDLTGDHIIDARVTFDEYGRPQVGFELDRSGGKEFKLLTRENINNRLGIIIDNVVFSAPNISSEIGSQGRITMQNGGHEEAKDLSIVLSSGTFQAPVKYLEERRIGPSLGQDSVNKGLMSCLIGLILVFIFSILFYKIGGLLAMFALVYNLFLIILALSYFGATLTLPGIAGMALTIGMAIDASILIYEKIKEDMEEGVTFRSAVNSGFKGAMVVILDSNITTFLTGLVLFYFGGPSIRGFAVTLMLGIIATIFAGIYFLKSLFDFILDNFKVKSIKL